MRSETDVLVSTPALKKDFYYYRNATFISLVLGYGGYYLCRQNLGIAFIPMKKDLGLDTLQLGWMSSIGTFTYAFGKVTLGSLADSKLGGKYVFYLGLFISSLFCLAFGFGNGILFFGLMWSLSRLFQSMGWSGVVNVMSQWFPKSKYGTAMGLMSVSYQFGGVLVSLYASLLLSLGGSWRSLFFIPALTLIAIGLITYPFLTQSPTEVGYSLEEQETSALESASKQIEERPEELTYKKRLFFLLTNKGFLGMLSLSFILTFLRECFNVWMPAYFTEMGESASIAAFKSTLFPFLGCLGTLTGGWISDRFLSGRRSPVMASLMLILVLCLVGLGHLESLSHFLQAHFGEGYSPKHIATFLVGAAGFFLLGSYSFVGGVVALDFGGKKTAGTAAGLLDGVGYLGATLAGVGFAQSVVQSGWNDTFMTLAKCTMIGILICLGLWNVNS